MTPADFLSASPFARAVFDRVVALLDGPVTVRASRSQLAFRRRRGFAYLWFPGQYLRNPGSEVVLSIALPRQVTSARFKQVAHPAPNRWMHHLEVHELADLDEEVARWLREAASA